MLSATDDGDPVRTSHHHCTGMSCPVDNFPRPLWITQPEIVHIYECGIGGGHIGGGEGMLAVCKYFGLRYLQCAMVVGCNCCYGNGCTVQIPAPTPQLPPVDNP